MRWLLENFCSAFFLPFCTLTLDDAVLREGSGKAAEPKTVPLHCSSAAVVANACAGSLAHVLFALELPLPGCISLLLGKSQYLHMPKGT